VSEVRITERIERPATVADRLHAARRRRFVGRAAELELFRGALEAAEPPFSVLWVHGPGGVGKTMLLDVLAGAARDAGCDPVRLDLRGLEPSPPAFLRGLRDAFGVPDDPARRLAELRSAVLLLDTFEVAVALEGWLRDEFVPGLPAGVLVVIAGRRPPGEDWRREAGWGELLRVVSLRNLGPDDARRYLRLAGMAEDLDERVLGLTHGHPLALAMVVELLARGGAGEAPALELEAVPDVVARLLSALVEAVPSGRHRAALELAAHARFTTEDLVGAALGAEDAGEMFSWLRGLSFVEAGPYGLFPHDLARDVLDADLRWRDPAGYEDLHRRIRRHVVERINTTRGKSHERAVADLIFLHRRNPVTSAFWDWDSLGQAYADLLRPGDGEAILAMTERHEGPESAAIAAHWLERQPQGFVPIRGRESEPIGFLAQIALHAASEADLARDPGARAAWEQAKREAPPRPGDAVLMLRFMVDRDAYQAPSPAFNVVTTRCLQEWVGRPALAWYFITYGDAEAGAPLMGYIHFHRAPGADFEVGGRRYGVFARDWRRGGPEAWLDLMVERELGGETPPAAAASEPAAMVALSPPEFAAAVRQALRDLNRPAALARNPLLRARVVADRAGPSPGPEALAALLRDAVAALAGDPRGEKLVRALDRTYLRPAPTQEAAAELLGLPFSTYRGHLARGVERVVGWCWQRELYGPSG
jgi:hypothetical protein